MSDGLNFKEVILGITEFGLFIMGSFAEKQEVDDGQGVNLMALLDDTIHCPSLSGVDF